MPFILLFHFCATIFAFEFNIHQNGCLNEFQVLKKVNEQHSGKGITFPVLVPNIKGLGKTLGKLKGLWQAGPYSFQNAADHLLIRNVHKNLEPYSQSSLTYLTSILEIFSYEIRSF